MSSQHVTVSIEGKTYTIDPLKIPYFSSYTSFQTEAGQDPSTHEPIPLFDIAYEGIEHGFRRYFHLLPPALPTFHTLCSTLDFLCVSALQGQTLDTIMAALRSGKKQYELEYKYYREVRSSKTEARDAAFVLLYMMLRGDFTDEVKDTQKAYNATLFVVSHSAIFRYRMRKIVREAFEERFLVTAKQRARLDEWPAVEPGVDGRMSERDDTTVEEDYDVLDDWESE